MPFLATTSEALAAETKALKQRLAPYQSVGSLADVPADSKLGRLRDEAAELAVKRAALDARLGRLREQLAKAEGRIAGADEHSNFAEIAAVLAEVRIVGGLERALDTQWASVSAAEAETASQLAGAWANVTGSRTFLAAAIDGTVTNVPPGAIPGRVAWAWAHLSEWLDVPRPTKAAA